MAERVIAGDRLYVDVWDNKEPLFYLTLALGRTVSPYMDVVLEIAWIALGSVAAYAIAREAGLPKITSSLLAWAATPLVLTGGAYLAGFTHLPGTVLLLLSYALLMRGKMAAAGALLPVIALFKILALPLAVAILVVHVVRHRTANWRGYALAAGAATAALAALLALRGELAGFLALMITNLTYSQSDLADAYRAPVWSHLEPVFQGAAVATLATIVLVLALTRSCSGRPRDVWWATLATLVTSVLIVSATGLWPHHAQILFTSAVLGLILLVAATPRLQDMGAPTVISIVAASVLLGGAPSLRNTADDLLSSATRWRDLARTATTTAELITIAKPGDTYARLGKNTDDSHAQGLRSLEFVCHQFLQYPYDPPENLERIPECLASADFVIVDSTFAIEEGKDTWNRFVVDSENILARDFTCSAANWGRMCIRMSP